MDGEFSLKKNLSVDAVVTDWLLEKDQPAIRSLTLTELLGGSEKDTEVKSAKESITNIGWAKEILE